MTHDHHHSTHAPHADHAADRAGGNRLLIAPEFESLFRANGLNSMEALLADDLGERLDKPGLAPWRQRRRIKLVAAGTTRKFFLKRFENPPPAARRLVRRSGTGARTVAGLEWEWLRRLHADGIAAPKAVVLAEEFVHGRERRSGLVVEAVPGQSLEQWMATWPTLDVTKRREVLVASARHIARFHEKGYAHRDLYLSHLFYDASLPAERALHLIDLQRVIRPRWRVGRWVVKDLASLNFSAPGTAISRADRVRWLRVYLGIGKLDACARRLAYRVMGKSAAIARREGRRTRAGHTQVSC